MKTLNYKNWQLNIDNDQVLWLAFDKKNASTNTLNEAVFAELDIILDELGQASNVKGVVIYSGKKSGFIAGADLESFKQITPGAEVEESFAFLRRGQQLFDKLAALKLPTVALIEGYCLGGGLELALACRYRIAEDGIKTKLGLPEVRLGIYPGWGGVERLSHHIGGLQAMDIILTGRTVDAKTATKMGFVDATAPKRLLKRAASSYVLHPPKVHQPRYWQAITNQPWLKPLIGNYLQSQLKQKVRPEHYPAPYAALNHWIKNGAIGEPSFVEAAHSISQLFQGETAKNLLRVFFLQERLKGLAKGNDFDSQHVHVVGAGIMGGDIAAWCALQGFTVTLQDREAKYIAPAIKRAAQLFKKKLKTPRQIQAAMDRLIADPSGAGVAKADVIIEAIFENKEAKQTLFKVLEMHAKPDAILATNTSSIPLDAINTVLKSPERLVGIHFFNPVSKMQLVEVVSGKKTDPIILQKAMAWVGKIERLPLPVESGPGFLVNRVLMPYLMEAMQLLEEGVPAAAIDKAAVEFGMPMGPVELADAVGLDVCLAVAENLVQQLGGAVPAQLRVKVANGELGMKSGQGFYHYKKGRVQKKALPETTVLPADMTDRLMLRMRNEAMACLREKVVVDSDLIDAGMVLGTGFAPFRGGILHELKTVEKAKVLAQLQQFQERYGDRFKPDAKWDDKS